MEVNGMTHNGMDKQSEQSEDGKDGNDSTLKTLSTRAWAEKNDYDPIVLLNKVS